MRSSNLYHLFTLCILLYICCIFVCSLKMFDLSNTDPLDLGFNNVLEDSCNYVDLSETDLCPINPDSLNLIQLNSRGVLGKQERIKLFLKELKKNCNIHAALLVETWLMNKNTKRFKIPGYNFVGCHRKSKQGGEWESFWPSTWSIGKDQT